VSIQTTEQFSALVGAYERLVFTVCRQMVKDASTAEDLCQETFLSAWQHRDSCPDGFEKQWLTRIAANKAKDFLQSAYERHTVLSEPEDLATVPRAGPEPEELTVSAIEAEAIRDMILSLREPYRAPCVLFFLEGNSAEETAKRLQRPEKTVRTQIRRAQGMLRAQIDSRERQKGARYGTV
jgi:RNA polymerase sigma factor (sigma-70 family)